MDVAGSSSPKYIHLDMGSKIIVIIMCRINFAMASINPILYITVGAFCSVCVLFVEDFFLTKEVEHYYCYF